MFIPAQTEGPAQVKTQTSISFPAENCSGAGPVSAPGRGGHAAGDGWRDGWRDGGMAPVTSGESRAKEKEATGWESMPAEAEGTVLLCLAFSSMRWRTRKDLVGTLGPGGDSASGIGADRQASH